MRFWGVVTAMGIALVILLSVVFRPDQPTRLKMIVVAVIPSVPAWLLMTWNWIKFLRLPSEEKTAEGFLPGVIQPIWRDVPAMTKLTVPERRIYRPLAIILLAILGSSLILAVFHGHL
jgi:hypothetical protein